MSGFEVLVGLLAASTAFSTVEGFVGAERTRRQAKANATFARASAKADEARFRRQERRRLGATRAAFGATGATVNEGTALDVMADQAAEGEELALNIRAQGAAQSAAFNIQAEQAQLAGVSTLIGGGLSLATLGVGAGVFGGGAAAAGTEQTFLQSIQSPGVALA